MRITAVPLLVLVAPFSLGCMASIHQARTRTFADATAETVAGYEVLLDESDHQALSSRARTIAEPDLDSPASLERKLTTPADAEVARRLMLETLSTYADGLAALAASADDPDAGDAFATLGRQLGRLSVPEAKTVGQMVTDLGSGYRDIRAGKRLRARIAAADPTIQALTAKLVAALDEQQKRLDDGFDAEWLRVRREIVDRSSTDPGFQGSSLEVDLVLRLYARLERKRRLAELAAKTRESLLGLGEAHADLAALVGRPHERDVVDSLTIFLKRANELARLARKL